MSGLKVSELESILGVSRQAIYDKLKQDTFKGYVSKIKGTKVVNEEGVKALKLEYGIENNFKDIKEEVCSTLQMDCEANKEFKDNFTEDCKEFNEVKAENKDCKAIIKELKDRIKYLETENTTLLSLLEQQNTLIQNEQQITLNHTELLLVEKREVLKLRQEQYELTQKKSFKKWFKFR